MPGKQFEVVGPSALANLEKEVLESPLLKKDSVSRLHPTEDDLAKFEALIFSLADNYCAGGNDHAMIYLVRNVRPLLK